ncbi:YIP1 family protein [Natronorubrum tibetense]|uniref:Yip1 domain-containing protein n=1 Tax=Natronorubrum tibetense GA33 TaxID=1114856 RepID=L9VXQ5_9EURY|nr:YIP1 family protein [Natronorubrum tibetense]ELY41801.1 hypothetical protein C496_08401 [Natronorubrum tibetense GA33]
MTRGANRTGLKAFLQREAAVGTLVVPTLAALLVGVAHLTQTYALYLALGPAYLEQIDLLIIFGLYRLLEGILLWGFFAAGIYLVSIPLGGTPLFGHVIRVVGWGLFPFVPAAIIWAAGRYYALRAVTYPDWEPFGMEQEWAKLTEYTGQTAGDPILVGTTLLGCGVLLASAHVWVNGVTTACDLDRRRASVVVAIPLGLYICWQLLGSLGV